MVSATVMAHPDREDAAKRIAQELDCGITWDERNREWDTARRALLAYPAEATHHLVIQDDAVLCRDLELVLPDLALEGSPVCLYTGAPHPKGEHFGPAMRDARAQGVNWLAGRTPLWGVAVLYPTEHLPELVSWGDAHPMYHGSDSRASKWYDAQGIDRWYTVPSLVEHEDGRSLLGHCRTARRAWSFIGRDASALDVDWRDRTAIQLTEIFNRGGKDTIAYRNTSRLDRLRNDPDWRRVWPR
jgi:hypothetical protein